MQQAGEQVVDRHKQRHGRHYVVGLSATDDLAGLEQDQSSHCQHKHAGDGQRQGRHIEEDRDQSKQKCAENADRQETAHEAEIATAFDGICAEAYKGGAGNTKCGHHDLAAVWQELQIGANDRTER